MNMDFGPWFYNYYRYLKGNRDGKESFNSTRFIDTMERFQKVKDLFNLQPYGIVGNTSGFEKLIDLMTRSNYTFEDMWLDLKNGYQIYYTYVRNRYVLFRTAKNCYTQKLLSDDPKNPQPRMTMLTLKRVKEMFPYMEQIEYKVIEGE